MQLKLTLTPIEKEKKVCIVSIMPEANKTPSYSAYDTDEDLEAYWMVNYGRKPPYQYLN